MMQQSSSRSRLRSSVRECCKWSVSSFRVKALTLEPSLLGPLTVNSYEHRSAPCSTAILILLLGLVVFFVADTSWTVEMCFSVLLTISVIAVEVKVTKPNNTAAHVRGHNLSHSGCGARFDDCPLCVPLCVQGRFPNLGKLRETTRTTLLGQAPAQSANGLKFIIHVLRSRTCRGSTCLW